MCVLPIDTNRLNGLRNCVSNGYSRIAGSQEYRATWPSLSRPNFENLAGNYQRALSNNHKRVNGKHGGWNPRKGPTKQGNLRVPSIIKGCERRQLLRLHQWAFRVLGHDMITVCPATDANSICSIPRIWRFTAHIRAACCKTSSLFKRRFMSILRPNKLPAVRARLCRHWDISENYFYRRFI